MKRKGQSASPVTPSAIKSVQPENPLGTIKKSKPLIIVFVLLLLGTLGFAGYFAYQNYQLKQQVFQNQPSLSTTTGPTPADPTPNWETYTSSSGKYSIEYPKEWILKGDEHYQEEIAVGMNSVAQILNPNTDYNNRISISTKFTSMGENLQKAKEVLELWRENYQGELKEITIDGISGYKLIFTYSDPVSKASRVDIRLEKNGLLYNIELSIDYESPNKNELFQTGNQILSTFKFINQADLTTNWPTYSDDLYQFSFDYPPDWQINCTKPKDDSWLSTNICELKAPNTIVDHGKLSSGAYLVIGVDKPNPNYSNLEEFLNFSIKQHGYNSTTKTINNIQGYQLTSATNSVFVFESKGHFIMINWTPLDENNAYFSIINQILSSFRSLQ